MSPEVSVVMSVYDGERYIRESVESILNQSFTDFEFIIVEDGSTDHTWEILTGYARRDQRILLLRNEVNIGLTKSLNKGLRRAQGKFIARQDADDASFPDRLASQVAYLQRNDHIGLLGTAYYVVDAEGRHISIHRPPLTDTEIRWQMLFHNSFCHSSVMFSRKLLTGDDALYNEDLPYSQDYDLWERCLEITSGANLGEPLVTFRVHDHSIEATRYDEQQKIACAIAARQINLLIPLSPLSDHEVHLLRQWYKRFPHQFAESELGLCQTLLQILNQFARQVNARQEMVRSLRRRLIVRILLALPIWRLRALWRSGLLSAMFRDDALALLTQMPKAAILRAHRALQTISSRTHG